MQSDRKDFLNDLKVENTNIPSLPSSDFPDRDVYTCLRLIGDTAKVNRFLQAMSTQEIDGHEIATDMSSNYFYSISHGLSHAEYDFREGKIDINGLNDRINKVCTEHNLDFNYLMQITDRIDLLQREPKQDASIKLAEEIETMVIKEHERRENTEREN